MGVLRRIGRVVGKVLKRVGDIAGKVISPIAQVAGVVAPIASMAAPALEASGPYGMAASKAAQLAPGVLAVAQKVAGGVENLGGSISKAAG